jgi:hypothetical protein
MGVAQRLSYASLWLCEETHKTYALTKRRGEFIRKLRFRVASLPAKVDYNSACRRLLGNRFEHRCPSSVPTLPHPDVLMLCRTRILTFSLIALSLFAVVGCGGSGPSTATDDEVKQFLDANPENKNPAPPSEAGSFKLE